MLINLSIIVRCCLKENSTLKYVKYVSIEIFMTFSEYGANNVSDCLKHNAEVFSLSS